MQAIKHLSDLPPDYFVELPSLGMVSVTGEEQSSYLQGQLTLDMDNLKLGQWAMACHCDFKGKTWNIYHCFKDTQTTYLLSQQQAIAASLTELKKYAVFAKVQIQDCSQQWHVIAGAGPKLQALIQQHFDSVPTAGTLVQNRAGIVLCQALPHKRYLLLVSAEKKRQLVAALATLQQPQQVWEALDIQAGMANIQQATANAFVPQMMNMQALDAISFSKGCYMGQEVIARTRYLGKNKRAAFILYSNKPAQLAPGDSLEMSLGENWRRAGTVLRSACLAEETWLLAVLAKDTDPTSILRSKQTPEQQFSLQALPYDLD